MNHIAIHQEETFQYYSETLENLKRMNDTINYLLNLVNKMQTGIDERLGWLTTLVGGLGELLMSVGSSPAVDFTKLLLTWN